MTAAPGWYAEAEGSTRQRWWDGTGWTEHVQDSTPNVFAVARPAVDGTTPVYGPLIWLIVLLPLITVPAILAWDIEAYLMASMSGELIFDGGYIALQAISWLLYAATVVCAVFDSRRLRALGYVRPFHWAWTFLSSAVYIIGRSVVVKKQAGRGLTPIWVMIAVFVVDIVVISTKIVGAMIAVVEMMPTY
ncbi:DUF2510 domain-containing protein [Glaciibacter psychrotolerans]|uniref:DUF2510 domain-containing protein n=1 Tax=Glaciibacter psychrotolerans TaxID=670054 RepID=A0A7Z0EED6_9MICO|nr:DUF2510 domain-containing protein [Leifsonia psychrotolerans]NYJ19675.1 hypothetical protein [Leifsonia psychrotolerans]